MEWSEQAEPLRICTIRTQAQVPGLSDSSSRGGSAFYNHRLSKMHYIGATYQYQMFLAYPTVGQSETQTQSMFLFYTVYFKPTLSVSFFGGPQYSNTQQFGVPTIDGRGLRRAVRA